MVLARKGEGTAVACLGTEGKKESWTVEDSGTVGEGLGVGEGKFRIVGDWVVVDGENIGVEGVVGWK